MRRVAAILAALFVTWAVWSELFGAKPLYYRLNFTIEVNGESYKISKDYVCSPGRAAPAHGMHIDFHLEPATFIVKDFGDYKIIAGIDGLCNPPYRENIDKNGWSHRMSGKAFMPRIIVIPANIDHPIIEYADYVALSDPPSQIKVRDVTVREVGRWGFVGDGGIPNINLIYWYKFQAIPLDENFIKGNQRLNQIIAGLKAPAFVHESDLGGALGGGIAAPRHSFVLEARQPDPLMWQGKGFFGPSRKIAYARSLEKTDKGFRVGDRPGVIVYYKMPEIWPREIFVGGVTIPRGTSGVLLSDDGRKYLVQTH